MLKLSDFNFHLPKALIAQHPLPQRSQSRLLVLQKNTNHIRHFQFRQLVELLQPHDLLIFNNTRVIPARLLGYKTTGGKIEILIERLLEKNRILAHIKNAKNLKSGAILHLEKNITVRFIARHQDFYELEFDDIRSSIEIIQEIGHIPLPPYIERREETEDQARYQTIFASRDGAVAAPTAGLHFDDQIFMELHAKQIEIDFITLHIGAGTFKPVRQEDITKHKIHAEYVEVSERICEKMAIAKQKGGRVIAVGTTTARSLETAAQDGKLKPYDGETRLFIYPSYTFRAIDGLITNFHLPQSTLLMLVCALGGYSNVMDAYQQAVQESYRFFSYGDAMLIV